MTSPALGSILLGSADPDRLREWYRQAFDPAVDSDGFLDFGGVRVLIDRRDDVASANREPGRIILNFHVADARAAAERLDHVGVTWVVPVEERTDGLFGTLQDPDGNYVQVIQLNAEYFRSRRRKAAQQSGGLPVAWVFSGFAVDDVDLARSFYAGTLGLKVTDYWEMLHIDLGAGRSVLVYGKDSHEPANYTILNLEVDDIDEAVAHLSAKGVEFERFPGMPTDGSGVFRETGPYIAWFRDPAGNILSVLQER